MAENTKKGFNLAEALKDIAVPDLGTVAEGREQIEYIDIDRIDDDPNNFYELSSLDELAANIELLGLQQPIRVRTSPENIDRVIIVSGHRRRAAIRKLVDEGRADMREIPCIREKTESSAALQELRLIYANSDTRKLSSAEISKQAERVEALLYQLKEEGYEFPGRMRDHVAEACKVSKSKLSRLKVIREQLIPELRPNWERGELSESVAYAFAQHPPKVQELTIRMLEASPYNQDRKYWYESTVKSKAESVVKELRPRKGPKGSCENCDASDQRLKRMAWGSVWNDHCSDGKCCHCCPNIGNCEFVCSHLSGEVAKAKATAKAKRDAELEDKRKKDEKIVEPTVRLWKRFGEARAAAGLTFEEYARKADVIAFTRIKRVGDFEQGRKITPSSGGLPYTGGNGLEEWRIRPLIKAADALGVSIDYLLCRTDDPQAAPEQAGQKADSGTSQVMWFPQSREPAAKQHIVIIDCYGDTDECVYLGNGELDEDCILTWEAVVLWTPRPDIDGTVPAPAIPEITAQSAWMPGARLPQSAGEYVAVFDLGDGGAYYRTICYFDGVNFCFGRGGVSVNGALVRWMQLPPEPEE